MSREDDAQGGPREAGMPSIAGVVCPPGYGEGYGREVHPPWYGETHPPWYGETHPPWYGGDTPTTVREATHPPWYREATHPAMVPGGYTPTRVMNGTGIYHPGDERDRHIPPG